MVLQLHNTPTGRVDEFISQQPNLVKLYTCGPTVYNYLHVGNWAAYVYWDTLIRTLGGYGYTVNRVMNITDVGHLTGENEGDANIGEDKLAKGARREGKTAWEVAEFYTDDFLKGMKRLNLIDPTHVTKATDFIDEQLELVRTLKEKGFTYQIDDGIYFDTAKFPSYADFAHLDLEAQKAGARVEFNEEKHNPSDFALWKFSPRDEDRDMEWPTPDVIMDIPKLNENDPDIMGFPGWHLECSAMAMSLLGETLDIHTGGIDHIPVHHTNEIAQSEGATGVHFSNYWLHNDHLKVNGTKISKSLGNGYTLDDLEKKGYTPLEYRMFVLQSHYRSEGNFTFENLTGAKNRLLNWRNVAALRHQIHSTLTEAEDSGIPTYATSGAILEALGDDLNTSEALHIIDEAFTDITKSSLSRIDRHALIQMLETIDELLGLNLIPSTPDISDENKRIILERQHAREAKDWKRSDDLREKLENASILVRDTAHGTIWEYAA